MASYSDNATKTKQHMQRQLKDLNLSDDFLFAEVMKDKEICKMVLERILEIRIRDINYIEPHDTKEVVFGARGIQLDIHAEDDENSVFTVEMQTVNEYNIPKRSRYYHSIIDSDKLIGKGVKYKDLKDNYVIFICTFDPFGYGIPKYTFKSICEEESFPIEDGAYTVILNSKWRKGKVSDDIKALLLYIENSTDEIAESSNSMFLSAINKKVREIKQSREAGVRFVKLEQLMEGKLNKGIELGIEQGKDLKDALYLGMKKDGRLDEYEKSIEDKDLFERLIKEYGIG